MKPKTAENRPVPEHLTGIGPLSRETIELFLERAAFYADRLAAGPFCSDALKGRVVIPLFFENSTRTRMSFEMAAQRLGAGIINFDTGTSSISKGETFLDTILNINAIGPDALIIRHSEYGAPDFVAKHVDCTVVNAGDSWREHPTQALLDALTIRQAKGRIEGVRVAIVGDIAHSRVASSNMILLQRLGAEVRIIAPSALMPEKLPVPEVKKFDSLKDGIAGCDIVMPLRLQKERMQAGLIDSEQRYFQEFGLTPEALGRAAPGALVMHPGPMNRGVEIADEVADDPRISLILKQAANGVPVRMAVLDLLINRV